MTDQQTLAMWVLIAVFGILFGALLFVIFRKKAPSSPKIESPSELGALRNGPEGGNFQPAADEASGSQEGLPSAQDSKISATSVPPEKTLKEALAATEKNFWGRFKNLFSSEVSEKNFEEIEEILYTSDLGPATVERVLRVVKEDLSRAEKSDVNSIKSALKKEFSEIFEQAKIQEPDFADPFRDLQQQGRPSVWLIVGVNGAGKTTSIGKIASRLAQSGKKVLVAAGDTFRAAAESQLKVWTERARVEIFSPEGITDPSAVAFDAISKAKAQGYDVVLIDTAGRLHTQANLMEELRKVQRVMKKVIAEAPHETLLVLDGNSGQNALIQAKQFHEALQVSGIVLTKMDGSAKGGVAVGVAHELRVPIRFIGIGEKVTDLRPFSAKEFIESIF